MEVLTRWSIKVPYNLGCSYSYGIDIFYKICAGLGFMLTIFRCRYLSETSEGFVFTAGRKKFFIVLV